MKILKPGKVEQRKFVCCACGCEFVEGIGEADPCGWVECPQGGCRGGDSWENVEPYEESVQNTQTDRERLYETLLTANPISTISELVNLLTANGVTFKEE